MNLSNQVEQQQPLKDKDVLSSSFVQNRTIEEIITKWAQDLDAHLKEFRTQAIAISKIDDELVSQGKKIAELHSDTLSVEGLTKELLLNLDYLEAQQTELEGSVSRIEEKLAKYYQNTPQLHASDIERDKIFTMVETCGLEVSKLDELLESSYNETRASLDKYANKCDPQSNLFKILESQIATYNWATEAITELKSKMDKIQNNKR